MKTLKIVLLTLATLMVGIVIGVGYIWQKIVFSEPVQVTDGVSSHTTPAVDVRD